MAKIIKTSAQEEALKTINADLRVLSGINAILNLPEGEGYLVTISREKTRAAVPVDRSYADGILSDIRKRLAGEVKTLSKKYAVELDEADMAVVANKKPETVKPDEEIKAGDADADTKAGTEATDEVADDIEPEDADNEDGSRVDSENPSVFDLMGQ